MPAPGGKDGGGKGNQENNEDLNPTKGPTLPTGTLFSDRSDFVKQMQAAGCTIVKEVTPRPLARSIQPCWCVWHSRKTLGVSS